MDSEPPQIGAPISLNAPQRPLRIGRGDKYYEVLYVGGVAQERRLGRRTNEDEARNSFILDSQQQEQKEEHPVLDAQDLPVSELNPQPSVRRRRSRQGLAVQPTPPLRRHRPGSVRSKESTPSRESSEASIPEELVRENSAQPTLYVLPEQDSEILSGSPGPVIVAPKINPTSMIPIYDKPRHIYKTVEQDLIANDVNADHSITAGARGREEPEPHVSSTRHGEEVHTEDEFRLRDAEIQMQRQHDSLRQQQEEWQRQQQAEQHKQQQEELAKQQRLALEMQQQAELEERQRLEIEMQQQAEVQKQRQLQLQKQREAEMIRQRQAEARRREEAEMEQLQLQRQLQQEFQRQQQAELQRQQQAELQRQQQAELQRQQQAEFERQQQAELQRQQQAKLQRQQQEELQRQLELQRQQQAELQRQHEAELQRQQEAELQEQQRVELERQQAEVQRQQQAERQRKQEAGTIEQQHRVFALVRRDQAELRGQPRREEVPQTTNVTQNLEWSQEEQAENLLRKSSWKGSKAEDHQAKTTLTIPKPGTSSNERDSASPSRKQVVETDSPRRQRSRSPHSMRYVASERHGGIAGESRALSEQSYATSQFKHTTPQGLDRRAESDDPSGNDDGVTDGQFTMQYVATTPMRAPVAHRETPKESTLGTTSPESLVDWYENDESFPAAGEEEDEPDGNVKRKPSKIIRKIKGLFENKKPDETPSSTSAERKRSDQLEPPPSPREPTTPTKRSKLGQFFSFNKKDERKRASPPPPLTFAPAVQGPEDIPDGMLAKVFRSKCHQERGGELPPTPKTAPPFPNFRDWSPSTEDLSTAGTGKEKEFRKPSKYFVPKIPPFHPRSQASPSVADGRSIGPPAERLGESLLAPDAPEARNSPYSLCRNRGSVKGTSPRRTSIVDGNVDAVYEEFFENERTGLVLNCQKPVEEPSEHTFVRKPSKKAAAIPPELRAPIYQPMRDETPSAPKQAQTDSEHRNIPPAPSEAEQFPPEPRGGCPYIEIEEELIEEEILEEPGSAPDNRNSIQELRPLFKQAWMLIDFMTQDLIDGVPKEAWGELRIFFMIMIGMLVLLYAQGVLRFAGNNPLCVIKTLFKGFQILLGSAIQAGMAIHDAVDAMLTDASSKIVADTLNEI